MIVRTMSRALVFAFFIAIGFGVVVKAAGAAGATNPPVQMPTPPPTAPPYHLAPSALPTPMIISCRGGGNNGLGYDVGGYKFTIVVAPVFKGLEGASPPFAPLAPGECGLLHALPQPSSHTLCFKTGSLDSMEYTKLGLIALKTTPDIVGQMLMTTSVYQFAVHAAGGCLQVDNFVGPVG